MGETIFRYLLRRGRWSRAASKYVVIFRWRCPVAIGLRFTVEADWWELNVVCRGNWWFGFWWRGRRNWGLVRHWIDRHLFKEQIGFYYDAPSTRIRFCLKTETFSFGLAFCPHVSGENDHQKRIFSKMLSRVETFENACFLFTCGRTKTKVFEFDDVIHRIYIVYY